MFCTVLLAPVKIFFPKLALRLCLYFIGIRFYKTDMIPKTPEFKSVVIKTVGDHKMQFFFFKETFEDLIYKRGKVYRECFTGIVIQARFSDDLPDNIKTFNNLKFFFNNKSMMLQNEELISSVLLNVFLDVIKEELICEQKTTAAK